VTLDEGLSKLEYFPFFNGWILDFTMIPANSMTAKLVVC
jgi:hypothetical protein